MNGFRVWALQDLSHILPAKSLQVPYKTSLFPISEKINICWLINNTTEYWECQVLQK